MVLIIVLGLAAVFLFYFIIPYGIKIVLRKRFLAAINKSESVCLTFDDGPNPVTTKKIINLLEEAGVKATFFVVGENVVKYPELVDQLINAGHELGEHSYQHSHPWKCGPFKSLKDLIRGYHVIQKYICLDKPILFRPPYGKLNLMSVLYVFFLRRKIVFWDFDLKDYKQQSADTILNKVRKNLFSATVILLHDGRRKSSLSIEVTIMAVKFILEECANRKLHLSTVSEALVKASKIYEKPYRV